MTDLLITILLNSCVIFGVYASFKYDYNMVDDRIEDVQLFGKLAYWMDGFLPEMIRKPFYGCPPCMATVWTPIVWFLFLGLSFDPMYFIAWIGTSGLNWLIVHNLEV